MVHLGYSLSSEEHSPAALVRQAQRAEDIGFEFALISDHYHPWVDRQGQSPFVWTVIGAVAQATRTLRLGTGVTCPTMRMHPALVAQAAATSAALMPQRFFLGVGTGENLNEHILGQRWPHSAERLDMFEEAIPLIRELWKGDYVSHRGRYFVVDEARLYTLPESPPPIYVAAGGKRASRIAAKLGDGLIGADPDPEVIDRFRAAGGGDKPRFGHLTVCWGKSESEARRLAYEVWPNGGLEGNIKRELKTPWLFEQAVRTVREGDVVDSMPCGPDPLKYAEHIQKFEDAGYDHVYLHNIGPDQEGFFDFFEHKLAPHLEL